MSKQLTTTKIKCRPKLDGATIALIINHIEQTQKASPKIVITWGQLEKRFNYSRQALEKHEPIKLAYRSANAAAIKHQNAPVGNYESALEPSSVTALKKALAKSNEECRKIKQQYLDLLDSVAQMTRELHKKGFSISGMTEVLPGEYQHPVFQMKQMGTQANTEH